MSFINVIKKAAWASMNNVGNVRGQMLTTPSKKSNTTVPGRMAVARVTDHAKKIGSYTGTNNDLNNSARTSSGGNVSATSKAYQTKTNNINTAKKVDKVASVNDLAMKNISGTMYEDIANKNNQIAIQMNRENNQFNAAQAQEQRAYEERLANTAHQREVQDLQAAGLNPILSAGGNGAVTPSGASASATNFTGTDNSIVSALAGLAANAVSANATMSAAGMQAAATQAAAAMSANATMAAASMNSEANRYASDNALAASKYSSDKGAQNATVNAVQGVISSIVGAYGLSKAAGIKAFK